MNNSVSRNNSAKDCLLIILLTAVIYVPFLGIPAWDGNEPLRIIIAQDMLGKGNWLITLLHGKPYFTKPPLMNWLIAISGSFFGGINEWTARLPSVLAVLATSLSLYFLTTKWLGREGRLYAAVSVLSMIGLIEKGRTAEIDSLFIFFVTLILLVWINGYSRQWKPFAVWSLSLTLLGVGFLAKGPQVIAFFYMTVFGYLFFRKKLSFFFSRSHLAGILFFILVLCIYLSFLLQKVTLTHYMQMWMSQITERAESKHSFSFLMHLISYPLEAVFAFLPCTLFLTPLLFLKDMRKELRQVFTNEIFLFSVVMIAVNFPLYWLLPNARFRYFLPAGAFVALATAVIFEWYLTAEQYRHKIEGFFTRFLKILSWTTILASVITIPVIRYLHLAHSPYLYLLLIAVVLLAILSLAKISSLQLKYIPVPLALYIGLFFLTYTEIDIQNDLRRENNPKRIAREINLVLPEDVHTVYEIGYRRFLGVTSYLNREVIQLARFSDLKTIQNQGDKTYFLFDTKFLDRRDAEEKRAFQQDIQWEKIYSKYFTESRDEVVLARLKSAGG